MITTDDNLFHFSSHTRWYPVGTLPAGVMRLDLVIIPIKSWCVGWGYDGGPSDVTLIVDNGLTLHTVLGLSAGRVALMLRAIDVPNARWLLRCLAGTFDQGTGDFEAVVAALGFLSYEEAFNLYDELLEEVFGPTPPPAPPSPWSTHWD